VEIDDKLVPPEIAESVSALVDEIPEKYLLDAWRRDNSLLKGFRPGNAHLQKLRGSIRSRVRADRHLAPNLQSLLRATPIYASLVEGLRQDLLEENLSAFTIALGKERVIGTLLLAKGAEVRDLGWQLIATPAVKEASPEDTKKAKSQCVHVVGPFTLLAAELLDAQGREEQSQSERPVSSDGALKVAEQKIKTLERKLEKAESELRDTEARMASVTEKHSTQSASYRAQITALDEKLQVLQSDYAVLQNEQDSRVNQLLQRALSDRVRPWLARLEVVDKALSAGDGDLIPRAKRILAMQRERDRHCGNLEGMRNRRSECLELVAELDLAARSAIEVVPELDQVRSDLQSEIDRLNRYLGGDHEKLSPHIEQILKIVNQTSGLDELGAVRAHIENALSIGIYDRSEIEACFLAIQTKISMLLDAQLFANMQLPIDPLRMLRRQLGISDESDTILFVDGYNVLFHVTKVFARLYEKDGTPGAKARNFLISQLDIVFRDHADVRIHLYFDGPEENRYAYSDVLKVIYTGGKGAHRADQEILRDLQYFDNHHQGEYLARVVTRDMDLARKAYQLAARRIDPIELTGVLTFDSTG